MNFRPVANQILVEYEDKPLGDIILPESIELSFFVVRALGEGFLTSSGWTPIPLKVGDRIQLKPTAAGKLLGLDARLINERKLGVVEFEHVAGVWEGELPSPSRLRKVAKIATASAVSGPNGDTLIQQ